MACEKCGGGLPILTSKCSICGDKNKDLKRGAHWATLALVGLSLSIYSISGALDYHYYADYVDELGLGMLNIFNFLAAIGALAALALAIVYIPRSRPVLKTISIILSGIVTFVTVEWIVFALR